MIAERIAYIRNQIKQYAARASIAHVPELIVVSKGRSVAQIIEAYHAGCRNFGENKWQEAAQKFIELKEQYPDIVLHFIGHLQRNKIAEIVAHCDVIHTIDRESILHKLADSMSSHKRPPRLLMQVNIGREVQKYGVLPEDAAHLLQACSQHKLVINGLMCLLPRAEGPYADESASKITATYTHYFKQLQDLAERLGLSELSMGMSDDYKQAVTCGSSWIRIGRGIFEPSSRQDMESQT